MRRARQYLLDVGVDEAFATKHRGEAEVRFVMHIHKKRSKGRKDFESLLQIAQALSSEVMKAFPEKVAKVTAPWPEPTIKTTMGNASASSDSMRQFVGSTLEAGTLSIKGFKENRHGYPPCKRNFTTGQLPHYSIQWLIK